jgi:hypothetical protein
MLISLFFRPPAKRRRREDSPDEPSDESEEESGEESGEDPAPPDEGIEDMTPETTGEGVLGRGGTRQAKVSIRYHGPLLLVPNHSFSCV